MERIENPKVRAGGSFSSTWYRFYPGFSESFARSVLSSAGLREGDWVLDPWNGGGTTTCAAASMGLSVCGYDLNPVMIVVAKARCLDPAEYSSLKPLAADIGRKARKSFEVSPHDPLLAWLVPKSVATVRGIEAAIQTLLVDDSRYLSVSARGTDAVSDLAAFFYVALFRTVRHLFRPFRTSNPTWLKRPDSQHSRLRPSADSLRDIFREETAAMLPRTQSIRDRQRAERILKVASSESLPLPTASVDFVLSSPPYCTRIDYAVATSAELSLLGFGPGSGFSELRRKLIGSVTVPKAVPPVSEAWGQTCVDFLSNLRRHGSKASATYYYKNHLQYFHSLSGSLAELARVLRPGCRCVLVVQDSYYKDLHNNLPAMLAEMGASGGMTFERRNDFPLSRTMAGINPGAKGYRSSFNATESVLTFRKPICSNAQQVDYVSNVV